MRELLAVPAGASYWSELPGQKAIAILGRGKSLSVLLSSAKLALLGADLAITQNAEAA